MTRRVAVICATHPLPNPGMASVDLAMEAFRRRYRLPGVFEYYRLYSPEERNPETAPERWKRFREQSRLPIEYRSLRTNLAAVRSADAIVYWGDFLHSRDFLIQTAAVLNKIGASPTIHDAIRLVLQSLYLADDPDEVVGKAYLFGGTLLFNTARDYEDVDYSVHLTKLVRRAAGVWMRDDYSTAAARRLSGDSSRVQLGTDCALFLRREDLALFPGGNGYGEKAVPRDRAGVFFGRNSGSTSLAAEFARAVCDGMGVCGEWLAWFDATLVEVKLNATCESFPGLAEPPRGTNPTSGDLLRRLSGYRFLVTDTYHACVNALNLGVPAVCVGESFPKVAYDVSAGWYGNWRDKRQVFYSMHDVLELYTTVEELSEPERFARRLHVVLETLRDDSLVARIAELMRDRALNAEKRLLGELATQVGNPVEDEKGGE